MAETGGDAGRASVAASARRWLLGLLCLPALALLGLAATARADAEAQFWCLAATLAALLLLNRLKSRYVSVVLVVLSVAVSARYLFWRLTETMGFDSAIEAVLGTGLFLAELFAFVVLILGYLQSVWPLGRQPTPLPGDIDRWPTVDVFVTTFDEPLEIVRGAVLAAMSMDYPPGRLRVHLLDDGRRPAFAAFAAEAGCAYLARPNNLHAKAGNLNHALARTDAELIAVFDADHVPTRAFLQLTVGAFLRNEKLAVVQTPHHAYSPDPFQRNIDGAESTPPESQLFYGVLQDGNDLWNAAFFCGSSAIIRRKALVEIDGFATETVTEDAHTALRLHRRGWDSAYLKLPLSAGLAPERFRRHAAQRSRWAHGMLQILRLENPLFGPGLSPAQRLCYLNAMLHYLFPLPRLAFLTAPLAFLLFGQTVIAAPWEMLVLFAAPHLLHAVLTNSRLRARRRHAFWGDIHETALAFPLLRPSLSALADPTRGRFDVTEKGGRMPRDRFDAKRAAPLIALAGLLALGLVFGAVRIVGAESGLAWLSAADPGVVLLNMAWAGFSLTLTLAAVAAMRDRRETRRDVRATAKLPATLTLADGRAVDAMTANLSMGGAGLDASDLGVRTAGETVVLTIANGEDRIAIEGQIAEATPGRVRVRFDQGDLARQRRLARLVFGRADAWLDWDRGRPDAILRSMGGILRGIGGMAFNSRRRRTGSAAAICVAAVLAGSLLLTVSKPAPAAGHGSKPSNEPTATAALPQGAPSLPPGPLQPTPGGDIRQTTLATFARRDVIQMSGVRDAASLRIGLRADRAVDKARLHLSFSYSEALLPGLSNLAVYFNGAPIGRVQLTRALAGGASIALPVDPQTLKPVNVLRFETGLHYATACENPAHASLNLRIDAAASRLELATRPLRLRDDLSILPRPFVDPNDPAPATIAFVLPASPSDAVLEAAAVVASYFGDAAAHGGLTIDVRYGGIGPENAVVFAAGTALPGGVFLGGDEPANRAYVRPNPLNPDGAKALILAGADDAGLLSVARHLAVRGQAAALSGSLVDVAEAPTLAERAPDDARRWIPLDRAIAFEELVAAPEELQDDGVDGAVDVDFAMPPRRFPDDQGGPLVLLEFDYPAIDTLDPNASRVDVALSGAYLKTVPLTPMRAVDRLAEGVRGPGDEEGRTSVRIDPSVIAPSHNNLTFAYRLALDPADCPTSATDDLSFRVQPSSTIDFSQSVHYTPLPEIAYFAAAAYPFTRMADLGETVVLLPDAAEAEEVAAFLNLMAHAGAATGDVAAKVAVARPGGLDAHGDKDVLIVGAWPKVRPALEAWGGGGPFRMEDGRLLLRSTGPIASMRRFLGGGEDSTATRAAAATALGDDGFAGVVSFERPDAAGRTVVLVADVDGARTDALVGRLRDPANRNAVKGDLARWTPIDGFKSFAVGPQYKVHALPLSERLRWEFADRPLALIGALLAGVLLLSLALFFLLKRIALARTQDLDGA